MARTALNGVLLATLAVLAPQPADAARRFALVVAENHPADGDMQPLRYADDDAVRYVELLSAYGAETRLLAVLDPDTQRNHPGAAATARAPTRAGIRAAMQALNAEMQAAHEAGERVDFYFVYAGHGEAGPNGEGRMHLRGEVLTRAEFLEEVVAASRADFNHLFIDACHAEALVFPRGGSDDGWRPDDYRGEIAEWLGKQDLRAWPNTGAVLAASADRETHEWEIVRGGVFSHEIRSGLIGMADANGDRAIEYSELAAWLAAAGQALPDARARPRFAVHAPALDRNRPLAVLTEGTLGYLSLPAGFLGRAWLEDARGVRYADLNPSGEVPVVLALAPSPFYYLRREDAEARFEAPVASLVDGRGLSWRAGSTAARGPVDDAFRRHLFSVPFGPAYYRGYVASSGEVPAVTRDTPPLPANVGASVAPPTTMGYWPWVAGGVAVGAGVAAVALGVNAQGEYDEWRSRIDDHGVDDAAQRDRIATKRTWSAALGGAAVAAGAGAVLLFLLDEPAPGGLSVAPTGEGLSFGRRF